MLQAIHVDCGKEFINEDLKSWCHEQGIEINQTAPYSPSQNGVAEWMNRTLVELAQTMRAATNLPEFLWEEATAHAAYLRNRSYTTSVKGSTPYQKWPGTKPNVTHL
jgi:transposase InsO family protein